MRKKFFKISDAFNALTGLLLIALLMMLPTFDRWQNAAIEIACLERNVYHEARSEPRRGQEAVAFVTVMRAVHDQVFPSSICGVVFQRRQFSWTLDPKLRDEDVSAKITPEIRAIASKYAALRKDPAKASQEAARLGLSVDTHFYKRFDWNENDPNEKRMSEENKWFWLNCLEPLLDSSGQPVRIGAHAFYRDKPGPCPKWPGPVPPPPERNPKRIAPH